MAQITIYSADFYVGDKPYCRHDLFFELSNKAVEFIENSISLAERKKAVLQVILTENELHSKMLVPHGVFLKSIGKMLAELILMSNDVLFLPLSEQNSFDFFISFNFHLKSTE